MQGVDLLKILRDEFAIASGDGEALLAQWIEDPDNALEICERLTALWSRLAQATRVLSLEGLARVQEVVIAGAEQVVISDPAKYHRGIEWLASWSPVALAYIEDPSSEQSLDGIAEYLSMAPVQLGLVEMSEIFSLLRAPISLPEEMLADDAEETEFSQEDASLALGEDVDVGLLESFLDDAPRQVAAVAEAAAQLLAGSATVDGLIESQRTAHTLKGSGNIVGVRAVGRLAHGIEDIFEYAVERGARLPKAMASDVQQAIAVLDQCIASLRGEDEAPTTILPWLKRLNEWHIAARTGAAEASEFAPIESDMGEQPAVEAAAAGTTTAAGKANEAAEGSLRVSAERVDLLLRRTGQAVVRTGRVRDYLRGAIERLGTRESISTLLQARLRELEQVVDKQGVSLGERQARGDEFDPLEMDQYSELQGLVRFIVELVDDERELASNVSAASASALLVMNDQARELADQYQDMVGLRLVPFRRISARLKRTVVQTANFTAKKVRLEIKGDQEQVDSDILERLTEPLLHLLRNAIDHGIETEEERILMGKAEEGVITVRVTREGRQLRVDCMDDGKGLDLMRIRDKAIRLGMLTEDSNPSDEVLTQMILQPGFSTTEQVTEVSGRGMGMDIVAERISALKGTMNISTEAFVGSTFTLRLPVSLGAIHALIVQVGQERLAIPSERVLYGVAAGALEMRQAANGWELLSQGQWLRWVRMSEWLGIDDLDENGAQPAPQMMSAVVVLGLDGKPLALGVNRVVDSGDMILQDTPRLLQRLPGVIATTLREDGRVLFVVSPTDLERHAAASPDQAQALLERRRRQLDRKRVLVVDDAISVRKTLEQLLQDAGYEVATARDGFDALQQLSLRKPDIVLTDLEMPNLNGIDLTRRIRATEGIENLPIVMITSRATEKHKERATSAGINAFLNKPYSDDELLGHVRAMTTL
jgi:chemotaxis protein histidine kinase CheA